MTSTIENISFKSRIILVSEKPARSSMNQLPGLKNVKIKNEIKKISLWNKYKQQFRNYLVKHFLIPNVSSKVKMPS